MKMAQKEDLTPGATLHRDGLKFHIQGDFGSNYVQVDVEKNGNYMGQELISKDNAHLYQVDSGKK